MELTLSQLRSITLGALDIRREGDAFFFCRMSDQQAEAFSRQSPELGPRASAPSGVRFDFFTDAAEVAVRYRLGSHISDRAYFGIDALVNGTLTAHEGALSYTDGQEGTLHVHLDGRENHVQIFLSAVTPISVLSVTVTDGASLRPYKPRRRILMHGDSITQGYDAYYPSACYANRLAMYYDAEIINQAIGGACLDPNTTAHAGDDFDFITVAYGTNDWRKKLGADIGPDADAFMDRLKELYPDTPVFVILPLWRSDFLDTYRAGDFRVCRALIGRLAAKHGFHVIDDFDMVPHDKRYFWDARLHPNEHGFFLYAQRLTELINEKLALM